MAAPNPPAFPSPEQRAFDGAGLVEGSPGMTLRDYFAGQALAGPHISLIYPEWQLKAWFGDRGALCREEITARAAYELADAMIAERANS